MSKLTLTERKQAHDYQFSRYWHIVFGRVSVEVWGETPNILRLRHDDLVEQQLCVEALPTNGQRKRTRRKRAATEPVNKRRQA